VIHVGHSRATIYKTPSRGSVAYTVVWYEGSKRKRKSFADYGIAEIHATSKVTAQSKGELDVIDLSGEERLAYVRAREVLSEFNMSMDSVAIEYRDAKILLRGGSLLEAARYYSRLRLHDIPKKQISVVYEEMIKAKRAEGLSERYIKDLVSRVGRFAREFDRELSTINGPQLKEWLQGLELSNRSRNNFRIALQTFFSFARSQRYLPKDWSEFDSVPVWKSKKDEVEIFTPDELTTLLGVAEPKLIPFLAIGAFAGLRSAEIGRLDWAKVNFQSGYITVDASIAKTNARRLVPITDNLRAWLAPLAKKHGLVVDGQNLSRTVRVLVDATRPEGVDEHGDRHEPAVTWKHNALRHSYCIYRLADTKNAAQVSLEAGNSPQMIFKHYRELVTEAEAKEWFEIKPKKAEGKENILEMPKRVA